MFNMLHLNRPRANRHSTDLTVCYDKITQDLQTSQLSDAPDVAPVRLKVEPCYVRCLGSLFTWYMIH